MKSCGRRLENRQLHQTRRKNLLHALAPFSVGTLWLDPLESAQRHCIHTFDASLHPKANVVRDQSLHLKTRSKQEAPYASDTHLVPVECGPDFLHEVFVDPVQCGHSVNYSCTILSLIQTRLPHMPSTLVHVANLAHALRQRVMPSLIIIPCFCSSTRLRIGAVSTDAEVGYY